MHGSATLAYIIIFWHLLTAMHGELVKITYVNDHIYKGSERNKNETVECMFLSALWATDRLKLCRGHNIGGLEYVMKTYGNGQVHNSSSPPKPILAKC
jgi:hypothetical protein